MSLELNRSLETTLSSVLDTTRDDMLLVGPTRRTFETLVRVATEAERPPRVRVLAADDVVREAGRRFLTASRAADLVADDTLAMRRVEAPSGAGVALTDGRVVSVVRAGERFAALDTADETFYEAAKSFYEGAWTDAETVSLRTPPLSRVRETLRSEVGEDVAADFDAAVTAFETTRDGGGDGGDDGGDIDEVAVSLLIAAKHRELLYDISRWGEDIGLASKATFSRTKNALEEVGVLATEKVPIDVGRPRLRLTFAEDHEDLREASGAELARVARSVAG